MKKTIIALFGSFFLLIPACQRISEEDLISDYTITASLERDSDTKVHLGDADVQGVYYPYWSKGDALALYVDNVVNPDIYMLFSGEGTVKGSFKGRLFGNRMVALYPASDKTRDGLTDDVLTLELPAIQQYVPASFGKDSFPMIAVANGQEFSFKNLCSVLKMSLTGYVNVLSIKFSAADNQQAVSGKAKVRTDFTSAPELEMISGGSSEVMLMCGSVELNPIEPTDFFLVIPPGTYQGGFTIEIETDHGMEIRSIGSDVIFERSQLRAIPTFECKGSGEINTCQIPDNQIWYKYGGLYEYLRNDNFDANIVSHTYENGRGIITFDAPLKAIYGDPFSASFTEIQLPDCVEEIRGEAFRRSRITSFRIPKNLIYLGADAFYGCDKLSRFYGPKATEDGLYVILEQGEIVAYAPAGVGETVILPADATSVAGWLFSSNDNIRHLIVPEGVKKIGESAFCSCSSLERVNLPSSLEMVKPRAFTNCPNLRSFEGDSGLICSEGKALMSFDGVLIVVVSDTEDYTIPDGAQKVEYECFSTCEHLRSITFPSKYVYLSGNPFKKCTTLEFFFGSPASEDNHCLIWENKLMAVTPICPANYSVPADNRITSISANAFSGNKSIENLIIPEGIIDVGGLQGMTRLKSVRLPNSLKELGYDPFEGNMNLEEVYLRSYMPPYYREWNYLADNAWGSDNLVIYVPKGFENAYKTRGWSKFANRIKSYEYDDLEIPDYYISQDYTRDGEVVVLQNASEGAGINLILMGDGYSDRQIENGSYIELMNRMMEDIFSVEPFTTYRRLFNVYAILVISETEGYEHGGQALGGDVNAWPRKVDFRKCWEYSERLVPYNEKSQLIIAAMNLDSDGGVAQLWDPNDRTIGDYGNGALASVVSITANSDLAEFRSTLIHEVGHGFAKLADEYYYWNGDTMPQFKIEEDYKRYAPYGWWKNVDFVSDITEVKWSRFLFDERYKYDGLGCFEGACTYQFGAWRPSEDSVMRLHNDLTTDFNAPSREAIWYRIHKLAYGDGWGYNYEDFVAYDALNRKTMAEVNAPTRRSRASNLRLNMHHPPLIFEVP